MNVWRNIVSHSRKFNTSSVILTAVTVSLNESTFMAI